MSLKRGHIGQSGRTVDTQARAMSSAGRDIQGFAMHQSLELSVWLGVAGLAFSAAQILLWRTRRVLNRSRQDALVPGVMLVPSAHLMHSGVTEPAGAGIAS
jgi:hypothetical protein